MASVGMSPPEPPPALVTFLYLLLRNDLPAGRVERLLIEATDAVNARHRYSNTWLAKYARNVAERLLT